MAAWDNVTLPRAPEAPSYAAPLVDFSNIGNLGNTYFQGQQQAQKLAQQQAFKNGAPTDLNSILQKTLQLGGTDAAKGLLPYMLMSQQSQQPWPGTEDIAAQAQPQQARREPIPPHGIPSEAPQRQGGDQQGSVMDAVGAAGVPDSEAGKVANTIAGRLGIDPNAAITDPRMATSVQNQLKAYRGAQPQQPTQTAQAQPEQDFRPYSQAQLDKVKQDSIESFKRASTSPMQKEALIAQGKEFQQQYRDMLKANEARSPQALNFEAEKEARKLEQERGNKLYQGIQGASREADTMRPHLDAMTSLFRDPNFYSGSGEGINLALKRVQASIPSWVPGSDPTAALPQEALRKVLAQNILNQVGSMKAESAEMGGTQGRIFQQQIQLMTDAAQKPENSVAALRYLTEIGRRAADHANAVARMASEYKRGRLDTQFDVKLADYNRQHPMFTEAEMKNIALVAPPVAPANLKTPEERDAWIQSAGLKSGDPFKPSPDSKVKYVP